jgi:hypothetical protein
MLFDLTLISVGYQLPTKLLTINSSKQGQIIWPNPNMKANAYYVT